MKHFYKSILFILIMVLLIMAVNMAYGQCTPQGNPATYGTNNTWIGYVYRGINFNVYKGYVNEGNSTSPNFDEGFGGDQVTYATNGCSVLTDTFSVRYRLTKTFADANYTFTVGGDDGYRLSLDGGSTWVINAWTDHSYSTSTYTVHLSGSYNMVLEYYENFVNNRISFNLVTACTGTGNPATYGTNNVWQAYVYQGMNFDLYKGSVTEGTSSNYNFDESFGSTGTYNTNSCSVQTQQFSVRYRLQKTFASGTYVITVGGDDGYRLSLDGGATWVINKWVDQSYGITTYTVHLSGSYNMVLEYFQDGGASRISFNMSAGPLPVILTTFTAAVVTTDKTQLNWTIAQAVNFKNFVLQRSADGINYKNIATLTAQNSNSNQEQTYSYIDQPGTSGTVYYRLAMVDIDGSITYSAVIRVQDKTVTATKIYPTVVDNGTVFIESATTVAHAKAEVFDMNGRKLAEKTWESLQGRQAINITAATGSYIVRLSDGNNILAKQVILVKQ